MIKCYYSQMYDDLKVKALYTLVVETILYKTCLDLLQSKAL